MLGARIAMLRKQHGLSQQDLARRLEISPSTIGMYEQGRREPACQTIISLADIFQVSVDYLMTGRAQSPKDLLALEQTTHQLRQALNGDLYLHSDDGSSRRFDERDLALILAALLG